MERDPAITVVLVDDHVLVREGLREIIGQTGEFLVVGEAADGVEALDVVGRARPDVVLLDVIMPRKDGVVACREIMEFFPGTRVVVLTASREEDAVIDALAAGATGYLHKTTGRDRLLGTLRDVASGELRVPAEAVSRVFAEIGRAYPRGPAARVGLTGRELEILSAFVSGKPYSDIAMERDVQPSTVRNAMYNIQAKVGVVSMQELVVWAVQNGLAPIPVPRP